MKKVYWVFFIFLGLLFAACPGPPAITREGWTLIDVLTTSEHRDPQTETVDVRNCGVPAAAERKSTSCSAGSSASFSLGVEGSVGAGAQAGVNAGAEASAILNVSVGASAAVALGFDRSSGESLDLDTPEQGFVNRYWIEKEFRIRSGRGRIQHKDGDIQDGVYTLQTGCFLSIQRVERLTCDAANAPVDTNIQKSTATPTHTKQPIATPTHTKQPTATPTHTKQPTATPTAIRRSTTCPSEIEFGQIMDCELLQRGQVLTHKFNAMAGDVITIDVVRVEGRMTPGFSLYDEDGQVSYVPYYACETSSSSLASRSCIMNMTGTFTLHVYSTDASKLGKYQLQVQRLNKPGSSTPTGFGQFVDGSLDRIAESDYYTFEATEGDSISISLSRTNGRIVPGFILYDEDGAKSYIPYTACETSSSTVASQICTMPFTGNFTLLVYSRDYNQTGNYQLYVQRLNNPAFAIPIQFGQVTSGSLERIAERDYYTFRASEGDAVSIVLSRVTGRLVPGFVLYDEDGSVSYVPYYACEATGDTVASGTCIMPFTGMFTLAVFSRESDKSGTYQLQVTK